jgi:CRP-like cAMP-binding protein
LSARTNPDPVAWPRLGASELSEMAPFGIERPTSAGELLFQAGDASQDLFVVLEGEVEVVRSDGTDEVVSPNLPRAASSAS